MGILVIHYPLSIFLSYISQKTISQINILSPIFQLTIQEGDFIKIIGLDSATKKTGWAIKNDDKLLDYGLFRADDNERNATTRIEQLFLQIKDIILITKPDYIIFENTHGGNIENARNLSRLHGCIMALAFIYDIGLREYLPSEWRSAIKLFDKSADSKKREYQKNKAIEYVNKKYGLSLVFDKSDKNGHDDQAEAICLIDAFQILK